MHCYIYYSVLVVILIEYIITATNRILSTADLFWRLLISTVSCASSLLRLQRLIHTIKDFEGRMKDLASRDNKKAVSFDIHAF